MNAEVCVFAPGKLFVIGEYAVLSGSRALVVAVDAGIRCRIADHDCGGRISAPDLGVDLPLDAARSDSRTRLLASAAVAAGELTGTRRGFHLTIEAGHPLSRTKRGLGGSAASVVAILAAVTSAEGGDVEDPRLREQLFPVALGVHREHQQGRGSGADVAASLHGGWIDYSVAGGMASITPAAIPGDLRLSAVWSGTPVDTTSAVDAFARAGARCHGLEAVLERFWQALEDRDRAAMLRLISEFGDRLGELAIVGRATDRLRELVRVARAAGTAAKSSGAAGGDCALAVAFDSATLAAAERGWRGLGAEVLPLRVDARGVRREVPHA